MENKLKYYPVRHRGIESEFEAVVGIIAAPNGVSYDIRYDPLRDGIVIMKIADDSTIVIQPMTSNQILIK